MLACVSPSRPLFLALTCSLLACSPSPQPDAAADTGVSLQDVPADATDATDATIPMDAMDASAEDSASPQDTGASRYTFPDAIPMVGDPSAIDPRVRGPFRTGYRVIMHRYTPRGASAPRTIPVHIWYPTWALTGPAVTYQFIVMDRASFRDAPPAPPAHAMGYPVHVFSHGDRGFGGTTAFLSRYFASHGWVTIAPDHVGNTISDTPSPRPYALYHLRSQDVSAALDAVDALPMTDPLKQLGALRTARTVLSGHSFGTHTVWSSAGATFDVERIRPNCTAANACTPEDMTAFAMNYRDPRFVAGIPMAGSINRSLFGPMGHESVTAMMRTFPMLAMSGTADPVGAESQYDTTAPMPLSWIDIRGGCHQFFAIGACSDIPDADQDRIVGAWALAFARRHVLDDGTMAVRTLLDGSAPVSDRVTLRSR
jgi:predicted dienelactone hydrolase